MREQKKSYYIPVKTIIVEMSGSEPECKKVLKKHLQA